MHSLLQVLHAIFFSPYTLLFPAVALEGPISTVIAGFLTAQGVMLFSVVSAVVIAADVAGDILHYAIGRWGRHSFLERWGKYVGVTSERLYKIERHFVNHSGKTILLSKIAHGVGAVFLVGAGMSKMPFRKFALYSIAGTIPKSIVLLLVGYYFGQAIQGFRHYFHLIALATLGLTVALLLVYILLGKLTKKLEKDL
jgi:membrane-associated protein